MSKYSAQIKLPMFLEYRDRRPVDTSHICRLKKNKEREFGGSPFFLLFGFLSLFVTKTSAIFLRDITHFCEKITDFYNQKDELLNDRSSYFDSSYLSIFLVVVSFSFGF